ncbi:MAG: YgiT-type zinc finger protein [Desulfococcaceae bacterium]
MFERKKIKTCPLCGSKNISHILGEHKSRIRGTAYNVPQTVCSDCGEIFLGPDSLEIIRMYANQKKQNPLRAVAKQEKKRLTHDSGGKFIVHH